MLLAWLPDRHDEDTEDKLVRGAHFVVSYRTDGHAPSRSGWEEQSGCSPPTIASAIAGLVCLADLLRRAGRGRRAVPRRRRRWPGPPAKYRRLAWSIERGQLVEYPAVVVQRYLS